MADFNPYAPPKAELSPSVEFEWKGERLEPFSIDAVMRRAWWVYRDRLGLCVAVVVASVALPNGFALLGGLFIDALEVHRAPPVQISIVALTVGVMAGFFNLWLGIGQMLVFLRLGRGERTVFEDIFRGGKYVLRILAGSVVLLTIGGTLVFFSFLMGGVLLALAWPLMGENAVLWQFLGTIALILVISIVMPLFLSRMILFPFVVMDRECGPIEALQHSTRITRGHLWELVALIILSTSIGASGFLACFVGSIFTLPFGLMIYACAYVLLAGPRSRAEPSKPTEIAYFEE